MDHPHDTATEETAGPGRRVALIRIGVGFLQGLALWGLYEASQGKQLAMALLGGLTLMVALAPGPVLAEVGRMRGRVLAIWTGVAALLLFGFGWYSVARLAQTPSEAVSPTWIFAAAGLFVAHHLVAAADHDRRLIGRFPTLFDTAWKHAVQLALSFGFTGILWGLLWLGALLFKVIGIKGFETLLEQEWFAFPVLTTAFAAAVHITDVRVSLIRGVRTVGLTLLAWLTPLMALIAAAFLIALPFTGLQLLWDTNSATASLLAACAALIVLINAVYQGGEPDQTPPTVLAWAVRVAAVVLVPLAALAAWGLSLRIGQYGLTPERIIAAAFVLVALAHAVGYAFAALRPGPWMKPLEITNVTGAIVALVLLIALFSPIADPARLSVNSQMARLESGQVAPDQFDYGFLRFDGERFGKAALERLKTSRNPVIAAGAARAITAESKYELSETKGGQTAPAKRFQADGLKVIPAGKPLPASFLEFDLPLNSGAERCTAAADRCTAIVVDVDRDGVDEVIVSREVYKTDADGRWAKVGVLDTACGRWGADVATSTVRPLAPLFQDLDLNGKRVHIRPSGCDVPPVPESRP